MAIERDVNVGWIKCARKRQFSSRKVAIDHAKGLKKFIGNNLRPYSCELCGGWHLYTEKAKK